MVMKGFFTLFFGLIHVFCLAQIIVVKESKYGIVDQVTGDHILPVIYDSIYALPFDRHISNAPTFVSKSPLFACEINDSIRIFNAFTRSFYTGVYNEVRLTSEMEDRMHPFPEQYSPNHIDCIMLRKDKFWGYIGHAKSYGFHDDVMPSDRFVFIEPSFDYLRFVEENVYSSQSYKRKKRVVVALKDSLYGALFFDDGSELIPFKYSVPVDVLSNAYNRRGIEFLSTKGGFVPYFIARDSYESNEQYIINAQGYDVSFHLNYPYTMEIYHEDNDDFLYVFSKNLPANSLTVWNYNSGKQILSYVADSGFYIASTLRDEGILKLTMYNRVTNRYLIVWLNDYNNLLLLSKEGKLNRMYKEQIKEFANENERLVTYKKNKNVIGLIVGNGQNLRIEWCKKAFIRIQDLN